MKIEKQKANDLSFQEKFIAFKDGKAEAPILHMDTKAKFTVNDNSKKVILSVEELDLDGEIVEMKGCRIRNEKNGIPMIDSHNAWASVTQNTLGAVRNPRLDMVDGKPALVGEPDFAPTPNGEIARILYMGVDGKKPYMTDVSMGFMVYDYDNETRTIKEWEVFELSLVTAGANRGARFVDKSLENQEGVEEDVKIAKDLARFSVIKAPFKEFTKLFLSEEFCKLLGYEKDGDLILDINNLYDIIYKRFKEVEAPIPSQEAPATPKLSEEQINKALSDAIIKKLEEIS